MIEGWVREEQDGFRWYTQDGEPYISVTTVLDCVTHRSLKKWFQKTSGPKIAKVKSETAQYGTDLHDAVERDLKGELVLPVAGLDSWRQLKSSHALLKDLKVEKTETIVAHPLGFAGQFDVVGKIGDRRILYDVKTGNYVSRTFGWQLAAYKLALESSGTKVDGMAVIHLPRDGREPNVFEYVHLDFCLQRFLAVFEAWKGLYYGELDQGRWSRHLHEYSPSTFTWGEHETHD